MDYSDNNNITKQQSLDDILNSICIKPSRVSQQLIPTAEFMRDGKVASVSVSSDGYIVSMTTGTKRKTCKTFSGEHTVSLLERFLLTCDELA